LKAKKIFDQQWLQNESSFFLILHTGAYTIHFLLFGLQWLC